MRIPETSFQNSRCWANASTAGAGYGARGSEGAGGGGCCRNVYGPVSVTMEPMSVSAIADGVLVALARCGREELVERVVVDHIDACSQENILSVVLSLAERDTPGFDALAARIAKLLGPEEEHIVCVRAGRLGERLEHHLANSRRIGTKRNLAARSDLRGTTISVLGACSDAIVTTKLRVSTATTTAERIDVGRDAPFDVQDRWCREDQEYRAWVYRTPDVLDKFELVLDGFLHLVPQSNTTSADDAYLVSVIETITNQPRTVRTAVSSYLQCADLSDTVGAAVIRSWAQCGSSELSAWVRDRYLRCFDTEHGKNGRVLREVARITNDALVSAWEDPQWLDVILDGAASRSCALASRHLPEAERSTAVRDVLSGDTATRSADAAALILNPNTTASERNDLCEHVQDRSIALLFYCDLEPATRGRMLAASSTLLETLIMLWNSARVCERVDETVTCWFTREVAQSYREHCSAGDASRLYAKYANIVIELDVSAAADLAGGSLCTWKVSGRLAEEIARQIDAGVTHPSTFSGLLHRWHGSVEQLITGSRKIHS